MRNRGGGMVRKKQSKTISQLELELEDDQRLKGRYETVYNALNAVLQVYLSHDGMTAKQLADALGGVSPKTAMRHIRQMTHLFHLTEDKRDGKTVFMIDRSMHDNNRRTEAIFSVFEILGLMYLEDSFQNFQGTTLPNPLNLVLARLKKQMPESLKQTYKKLRGIYSTKSPQTSDYSGKVTMIETLHSAAVSENSVEIDYSSYSSKRRIKRIVHPYNMTNHEGSLYLIAFDTVSKSKRMFKIDRIHSVTVTGQPFQRPLDFDIVKHLASSFGVFTGAKTTVTAIFDDKVASYIKEKKWHESQRLDELADGRLKTTWEVAGTKEIKIWLMGFCEHVEVVGPVTLREEIVQDLHKMFELYSASQPNFGFLRSVQDSQNEAPKDRPTSSRHQVV